jgi:hypothetical protein
MGLAIDSCYDTGTWGDFDNDGRLDLYVNGTITRGQQFRDYLFHNDGERFSDATPGTLLELHADHGAHWFDYDRDGDLDLGLTGASPEGMHYLLQNQQAAGAGRRSIQVRILDEKGHHTRAGTEVRLYRAGTDHLLGTRIVDTGSGYNSQNAMPVHFGLGSEKLLDLEITSMCREGRARDRLEGLDPQAYAGRILTIKIDRKGRVVK